jgi:hypothetical protein
MITLDDIAHAGPRADPKNETRPTRRLESAFRNSVTDARRRAGFGAVASDTRT